MVEPRRMTSVSLCVMLLVTLVLLGNASGSPTAADSDVLLTKSASSDRILRADGIKRRLQSARLVEADESSEDRSILDKIPGVGKLVKAYKKSQSTGELEKLLASTPPSSLFESQQFKTWSRHISAIYPGKADEVVVSELAAKYGDEALTSMLIEAKAKGQTKAIASRLEAAQIENWLSSRRTADDIFEVLNLRNRGNSLVWTPAVRTWYSYVTKLSPENADEVIYSVLKTRYTNQQLGNVIMRADKPGADIAARLQSAVLKSWLTEHQSADDVFNFLLKKHGETAFRTRAFDDWVAYVKMVDKETPFASMFAVLYKRFGGNLPKMLEQAKKVKRTKDIATKLQKEMVANSVMGRAAAAAAA